MLAEFIVASSLAVSAAEIKQWIRKEYKELNKDKKNQLMDRDKIDHTKLLIWPSV